jgi:hypothetical protein
MAEHSLIAAYGRDLGRRLPAALADEVLDGLAEAHEKYLRSGLGPDEAARAAIAEFGDPATVADAFCRDCPARRLARTVIVTGPAVGTCWAAVLITGRAWDWPIPAAIPLLLGVTLTASVALLVIGASSRRYRAVRRAGTAGCLGVALLDASAITTALLTAPTSRWLIATAVCASLARLILIAARRIPVHSSRALLLPSVPCLKMLRSDEYSS